MKTKAQQAAIAIAKKEKEIDEVAANAVAGGGVDLAPNAARQKQRLVKRFKEYIKGK